MFRLVCGFNPFTTAVHNAMCYNMSIAEDYRNTMHFILNDCLLNFAQHIVIYTA